MPDKPVKVLLVEDNSEEALMIQGMLKRVSCEITVTHVLHGKQAIQFLTKEPPYTEAGTPDVILLDWHMPVMDGPGLLRWLSQDHRFEDTPVVVLTDSRERDNLRTAYMLNAVSYQIKPMTQEEIDRFVLYVESILLSMHYGKVPH